MNFRSEKITYEKNAFSILLFLHSYNLQAQILRLQIRAANSLCYKNEL
jgi:hypothetical protein